MKELVEEVININFDELKNLKLPYNKKIGLNVLYNQYNYEFIIFLIKNCEDIVVCGSGFLDEEHADKLKNKPIFARHSWIKDINKNMIYYNDPTRYDFDKLRGGWGIGTPTYWHLEKIAEIIKVLSKNINSSMNLNIPQYSNLLFYGSSMGGFMSIVLSTLIKNSTSLADIPQLNLKKWWYWNELKDNCFKGLNEDEINLLSYRFKIIDLIKKEQYIPNSYIRIDCSDKRDWETQHKDFLNSLNSLPYIYNNNENRIQLRFDGLNNGHAILNKKETIKMIYEILDNKNFYSKNSLNKVKLELLNIFEENFNKLCSKYSNGEINFNEFLKNKLKLLGSYNYARVDIKNVGVKSNIIEIENNDQIQISFPTWFEDDEGQGCKIESNKNIINLKFKCVNDGKLYLNLRGRDFRDLNNNRIPIPVNYKKLIINNHQIFSNNYLVWHDQPYKYIKPCKNGEIIKITIEFEDIYDYYPELNQAIKDITEEYDFEYKYNELTNMISYNKELLFNLTNPMDTPSNVNKDNVKKINLIENQMNLLAKKNSSLIKENRKLYEKINEHLINYDEILNSYNLLFNNILIRHKLEPRRLLKYSHELQLEILDFISNVCKKYNLQWWLYAGTLLGAIRHEGFIPWDDDCDINMIRPDYEKFIKIIDKEIKANKLQNRISVKTNTLTNTQAYLPFIKVDYRVNGKLFGFIDIMPSDYINSKINNMKEIFTEEYKRVRFELKNGQNREIVLTEAFEKLNVSPKKTNLIMTGVEDTYKNFAIFNINDIFPLSSIKFENRIYPCPNNKELYIKSTVGSDYMKIPKIIYDHGFHDLLSKHENVYEIFETEIEFMHNMNERFTYK